MWLAGSITAATLTLTWDAASATDSYRLYSSTDIGPFNLITNVTATTVTVGGVPTNASSRWYVTALNAGGESPPSNVVTNTPTVVPPPTGLIGISVPVLTATNLVRGATVTGTARFTNGTTATVQVNQGWLTARQPGASNQSGPFDDWSPGIPSQAVNPGQIVTLTASWVVRADAPFGTWQVHLAVQVGGVYNDGPSAPFNVVAAVPQPPAAPTNLRAVSVGANWIDMTWDGTLAMSTEVQRSKESDPYMRVAVLAPGVVRYKASNLQKHRDWKFRVRQGTSDFSNELFYSSR